ncbi:MAG TPA: hypothetical protein VL986_12705 [Terracidiphilus sp.]|nr:hypothetical protein [Terracidiphilus sp.]
MKHRAIRNFLSLFSIICATATVALGQSSSAIETGTIDQSQSWQGALSGVAANHKVFVVTIDKPDRKQKCRIESFDQDKLICSRAIGSPRTYLAKQVIALILPGDGGLRVPLWIGLNGGLGAAIWGTVVLAAACPACAVGTGIAALFFFAFAGAVAFTDDVPNRLLYLAPGNELSEKLGYVQQ